VSPKPFQLELASSLDPSRDLQRIYSLFIAYANEPPLIYGDFDSYVSLGFSDAAATHRTLQKLIEITKNLEQIHNKYKQTLVRQTKYGSRQAPIGDDNYFNVRTTNNQQAQSQQQQQQQQQPPQPHLNLQHIDKSPNFFYRKHYLQSSPNNENFSQC
jgi:Ras GTPase-activating protein 3